MVAVGLVLAACFGVTAEASTLKVKMLGVEFEGTSIIGLAFVVFVAAALFLLKAKKETPIERTAVHVRGSDNGMHLWSPAMASEFANPPVAGRRLHLLVNIALISVGALIIFAAIYINLLR